MLRAAVFDKNFTVAILSKIPVLNPIVLVHIYVLAVLELVVVSS